jgi:hypothetical protein
MKKFAFIILIVISQLINPPVEAKDIIDDARTASELVALALNKSGYNADFSIESLKEIDRFFDDNSKNGKPNANSLLHKKTGEIIFSIASYVGEVLIRAYGGHWEWINKAQISETNLELHLDGNIVLYPVEKVIKRLENGKDDSLYKYGQFCKSNIGQTQHENSADAKGRAAN